MNPTDPKAASTQATPTAPKTVAKPTVKAVTVTVKKVASKPQAKAPAQAMAKATAPAKASVKKAPAKPTVAKAAVAKPVAEKPAKVKKIKMVRDSFTMPKPEFAVLDLLKLRAAKLSIPAKKTEVMRAGIKALASMTDADFLAAIRAVPNLKTGRPAKA